MELMELQRMNDERLGAERKFWVDLVDEAFSALMRSMR
jgi:hypothetical protein